VAAGTESISSSGLEELKQLYNDFVFDIAGLKDESGDTSGNENKLDEVLNILLSMRIEAKKNKDFTTADKIREQLNEAGIIIKDTKDGFEWELK